MTPELNGIPSGKLINVLLGKTEIAPTKGDDKMDKTAMIGERIEHLDGLLYLRIAELEGHRERLDTLRVRLADTRTKDFEAEERGHRGLYSAPLYNTEQDILDTRLSIKEADTDLKCILIELNFLRKLLLAE